MHSFTKKLLVLALLCNLFAASPANVKADTAAELQQNINSHAEKIKQLDAEIKTYQKQIEVVGGEAKNLQNAIQVLDINQKKIGTEIKKTETNIQKTNLTIEQLGSDIDVIRSKISSNSLAIAKTLSIMQQNDSESLVESFLKNRTLADVVNDYESMGEFESQVRAKSMELDTFRGELEVKKTSTESEKKKLQSLNGELKDQNQILLNNKKEKNTLLAETKNKETEYKSILATRQAEKEKFEKELFDFESRLKRVIDPNSFPSGGKGIISYPLDSIVVTQAFGATVDAKRLYVSGTHNGVDFRATRGTPVKSVSGGVVKGIGNTDEQPGCYSYGKWILIDHDNGLSSLYAHLDLIKATPGSRVETGEVIGYSGQTGYATGPHLHLTLYASQGVEIQKYSASINCKNVSIPVASSKAYLDPMQYF